MYLITALGANSLVVKNAPDEIPFLKDEISEYFASPVVVDRTKSEEPRSLAELLST